MLSENSDVRLLKHERADTLQIIPYVKKMKRNIYYPVSFFPLATV